MGTKIPLNILIGYSYQGQTDINGNWEIPVSAYGILGSRTINLFIETNTDIPNSDFEEMYLSIEGNGLYMGADAEFYFTKSN
jgi:hypothetical protein